MEGLSGRLTKITSDDPDEKIDRWDCFGEQIKYENEAVPTDRLKTLLQERI